MVDWHKLLEDVAGDVEIMCWRTSPSDAGYVETINECWRTPSSDARNVRHVEESVISQISTVNTGDKQVTPRRPIRLTCTSMMAYMVLNILFVEQPSTTLREGSSVAKGVKMWQVRGVPWWEHPTYCKWVVKEDFQPLRIRWWNCSRKGRWRGWCRCAYPKPTGITSSPRKSSVGVTLILKKCAISLCASIVATTVQGKKTVCEEEGAWRDPRSRWRQ